MDTGLNVPIPRNALQQAFADDLLLEIWSSSRRGLELAANPILEAYHSWAKSHKLRFSASKTFSLTVAATKKMIRKPIFKLNSVSIASVSSLKILGITIDETLCWLPHVFNLHKRISLLTYDMANFARNTWGIRGSVLRKIYKASIERVICYGCAVWWKEGGNSHLLRKLATIQRVPLLRITRSYRTVSTHALQVLAGVKPIHLTISEEACYFNMKYYRKDGSHTGVTIPFTGVIEPANPWRAHPTSLSQTNWLEETPANIVTCVYSFNHKTYTIGVFVTMDSSSFELPCIKIRYYKAEVSLHEATMRVIQLTLLTDPDRSRTTIIQLQSSKRQLQNKRSTDAIVTNIQSIAFLRDCDFRLITPEETNYYNSQKEEIVNMIRNTEEPYIDEVAPSPREIKTKLHDLSMSKWQENWNESDKGRYTHLIYPKVRCTEIEHDFFTSQLASGHGKFPSYLYDRGYGLKPECVCGSPHGDAKHYLINCDYTKIFDDGNLLTSLTEFKADKLKSKLHKLMKFITLIYDKLSS